MILQAALALLHQLADDELQVTEPTAVGLLVGKRARGSPETGASQVRSSQELLQLVAEMESGTWLESDILRAALLDAMREAIQLIAGAI